VVRDYDGNWNYKFYDSRNSGMKFNSLSDKLNFCYSNPALMMALKLNADLFSLVRINSYKDGVISEENYLHTVLPKPNPYQTWEKLIYLTHTQILIKLIYIG